jgi:hypothetical protein
MSDAKDAVDEAKRLNRQLAARRLVQLEDLKARGAPDDEIAAAKYDYEQALAELKELDRLGAQAETLAARSIMNDIDGDPVLRSPEQVALDNVRDHIANLGAQVKVGEELAGTPAAAPAPAEDPDEAARKQFEALRAKPKKTL